MITSICMPRSKSTSSTRSIEMIPGSSKGTILKKSTDKRKCWKFTPRIVQSNSGRALSSRLTHLIRSTLNSIWNRMSHSTTTSCLTRKVKRSSLRRPLTSLSILISWPCISSTCPCRLRDWIWRKNSSSWFLASCTFLFPSPWTLQRLIINSQG